MLLQAQFLVLHRLSFPSLLLRGPSGPTIGRNNRSGTFESGFVLCVCVLWFDWCDQTFPNGTQFSMRWTSETPTFPRDGRVRMIAIYAFLRR